ncbi:hypothetical protein BO70DRAFT_358423 [Aspergillus heteromorphus CBS 117.55]|uniref:Hydrophobin n=1 Tax=Aspergillus heteromorphus CBS 117.55 TaxID=1448321 RepID=A0A317WX37_9EURO|nr:uncharacterized protein BO70DRAFT_358423 [Aspergillus heteromorphus CBS 117.55]PWY90976.1 hypothetical protein BO70DRAFT_358423 [Aspergillus heteromorphus CBS 117.55]
MKPVTIITLAVTATATATASGNFTCIKPVNPIPAGPPGVCCEELVQSQLLGFLYTGKTCTHASELSEAADGTTTYSECDEGEYAACCDPVSLS